MGKYVIAALLLIVVIGCATAQQSNSSPASVAFVGVNTVDQNDFDTAEFDLLEEEVSSQAITVKDSIEPWNRLMHNTNDGLYFWVLKPVAQGYKAVIPEPGRIGIRNVFQNLATPVRLVNCLLQGKFHSAGNEINRCVINTTWGVLGIWDPAKEKGKIEPAAEDMGQTLAVYGLDNGCYLVWPLFGPSTLRDSAGMGGDFFLSPTYYIEDTEAKISIFAVNVTNRTSLSIGEYEAFKAAAVDPYVAMRNAYIQYRQKQVEK
jgi:phospholipid-binding lipoprotein MlaA